MRAESQSLECSVTYNYITEKDEGARITICHVLNFHQGASKLYIGFKAPNFAPSEHHNKTQAINHIRKNVFF